ncbi:hypothetical protein GCM10010437_060530 [Actinoplanes palleronii]
MPARMYLSLPGRAVRVRNARSRAATAHLGALAARTTRPRTATAPTPTDRGPLPPHRHRAWTSTVPSVPSADSGRPTGAERGPRPPHRRRTRTSTAPPVSITHADRHNNTERRDNPARNDTPTHLHPNTSGTTPRPQSLTEIKIG